MFLRYAEEREKVDHLVHKFDIGASACILRILQDIGEESDEGRYREVEYQPLMLLGIGREGRNRGLPDTGVVPLWNISDEMDGSTCCLYAKRS